MRAQVAKAKGEAEQIHIAADREFYEKRARSKAILAEATARAKSIEKQNKGPAGAGGRTAVKLRIADALPGQKPIMIVPAGNGAALQKLDLNRMLESIIAQEARSPSKSSSSSDD